MICQLAAFIIIAHLFEIVQMCPPLFFFSVFCFVSFVLSLSGMKCNFPIAIARCYFPLSLFISFNFCFVAIKCSPKKNVTVRRAPSTKICMHSLLLLFRCFCFSRSRSLTTDFRPVCFVCSSSRPNDKLHFISINENNATLVRSFTRCAFGYKKQEMGSSGERGMRESGV